MPGLIGIIAAQLLYYLREIYPVCLLPLCMPIADSGAAREQWSHPSCDHDAQLAHPQARQRSNPANRQYSVDSRCRRAIGRWNRISRAEAGRTLEGRLFDDDGTG